MFGLFTGLKKLFRFLFCLAILVNYSTITPKDYLIPTPWLKQMNAPQVIVDISYAVNIPHMILWHLSDATTKIYGQVRSTLEQEEQGD